MRLFHLSDLHIGKRVNEFSMIEDQKYILERILDLAEKEMPDGVILAGDIYDKPRKQFRCSMSLSQSWRRENSPSLLSAETMILRNDWLLEEDC